MKKEIKVGLLGCGTVGSGVLKILQNNKAKIQNQTDASITVKQILVKDIQKKRADWVDKDILTTNPEQIISDSEIDIIVEVMGGIDPAKDYILRSIKNKKNIVTANKDIMSRFGQEILGLGDKESVDVYFEASVGGGIPIVRPLKNCLVGNRMNMVMGIINGTTNYVLTRMSQDDIDFNKALFEAQEEGYAEADPESDISGADAAAKIAILASIAFNARVKFNQVFKEGISEITTADIVYSREMGYVIKLVALAKITDGKIEARVHPTMIKNNHPLASVNGIYNAIFVVGDSVGEVMFFGQGAGSMPTASAVVGDIVEIARNLQYERTGKVGCTCFESLDVLPISDIYSSFYIRMTVLDKHGVLAQIAKAFGDNKVSIDSVVQKQSLGSNAELIFITHITKESDLRKALDDIDSLDVVEKVDNVIRVEVG